MTAHKLGCWLKNGGPRCTCYRGSTRTTVPFLKEIDENMLNKLMNFDPRGGFTLSEVVVLAAFARQLEAEYDLLKVEKPEGLLEKIEELRRFVADTQRAERKQKLVELKARRTQYLSANEKREMLDKQIAELEALSQ